MILCGVQSTFGFQCVGDLIVDQAVGDHPLKHLGKCQTVLMRIDFIHATKYSMSFVTLCNPARCQLQSFTHRAVLASIDA